MPKVHFVRRARKNHKPDIKRGSPYYWWWGPKPRRSGRGRIIRSSVKPKPSQLTVSPFRKRVLELREGIESAAAKLVTVEGLTAPTSEQVEMLFALGGVMEDAAGELEALAEEQAEARMSLPQSLQGSATGQLLERREEACRMLHDQLQSAAIILSGFAPETADEVEAVVQTTLDQISWEEVE